MGDWGGCGEGDFSIEDIRGKGIKVLSGAAWATHFIGIVVRSR